MGKKRRNNDLFETSHIIILVTFTVLSAVLIFESLLMGWEKWVLILIILEVIINWIMHIAHIPSEKDRMWIYSAMMMVDFFFYGIHLTSTFDLAVVMSALILLCTLTGQKALITVCQITYYITLAYGIAVMVLEKYTFDSLIISRTIMHAIMIYFVGFLAKTIIDKWMQVIERSKDEIIQLTDATERLNDFLANVSHELRTPINAVIGLSTICIEKENNPEIKNEMISVRNAGRKVAEQIGDILDYSEIDRDKLVRNNEDYMLSSVLYDLVTEIRPYKSPDIELIIDVDPSIPSVMNTDVNKLKKILKALITNGLKYTNEGGVYVRITTEKEEYGVNLCIEVTDTGIGMNEEELERIYEGFYQADSGRSRMGGGLGLGMSIVIGFVSILGGFMTVKSKPDHGTVVRVSLPQTVIDERSCMSVNDPEKLCLGAFLHFDKYTNPSVRDYYNSMVLNMVKGLGVQMHRVDNAESLRKLRDSVTLTHLFIAEEEYHSDPRLIEEIAGKVIVVVVANSDFKLPLGSKAYIMEKPFYCFPVASVLNSEINLNDKKGVKMYARGIRALVVDDEPMNLTVGKSIFARYGMVVSTANSGPESIDMCKENEYDIVFMDHMMGGMDGVEAMKRIRAVLSREGRDMPIVALTANAMSSAKQMFLSEGFDGFVSKPIETEELERVLKRVLPKSRITYEDASGQEYEFPDEDNEAEEEKNSFSDDNDPLKIMSDYGIKIKEGLKYCMDDRDFYENLLKQYVVEADAKRKAAIEAFENKDWHNYAILLHALKSTSKMIGAMEVSEKAKELEKAAKEENAIYIMEHHPRVLEEYIELTDKISEAFGTKKTETVTEESEEKEEALEFEPVSGSSDDEVLEFAPEKEDSAYES
ncbi:MAG: response regulator [Lachnospiraceae bacterium]|nr:response regulator [Lachnospiraceae bacterium]